MWLKELKRYLGIFLLGAALIVVYKTFDNFGAVLDWGKMLLDLLTPFIIGGCIAYVLCIPCRKLEGLCLKTKSTFLHKYRRGIAIASIYLIFFAAITLLLFAVVPALTRSISDFITQLPSLLNNFFGWLNSLGIYGLSSDSVLKFLNEQFLSFDKLLGSFTADNVNRYAKGVMSVGTAFFNAFMGIIISIYLLIDRHNLKKSFHRFFHSFGSEKYRNTVSFYAGKINEFIHLYISCQLLDALIVFGLSFVVLALLRVKYSLLLAFIMGSFNLIPYFGAIVATILAAVITAFTKDFTAGLIVAAAMIVLQQIDSNFIQPKLVSGSLHLAPFWVIFAIVIGGGLFGILGIFLAVPVFALLRIIILDVLDRREKKPTPAKTK
ncbi:MAG: AI-2E family transporter [Clostridia bacterium]|nr:AI-2E family transporter [Clostridia bacterium]